jgi:hypothetical protein
MRTAHASESTMKGEQGRGGAVKVFGEVPKDRAAYLCYLSAFTIGTLPGVVGIKRRFPIHTCGVA